MSEPESHRVSIAPQQFAAVVDQVRQSLTALAQQGLDGVDCSRQSLAIIERWGREPAVDAQDLDGVRKILGDCRRCRLARGRKAIVFGEGDADADLVFVGEYPAVEDDRQGRPFTGSAGRLLARIIEAMSLTREQVYLCSIVKCCPTDDRPPSSEEIEACLPFLKRQLAALQPKAIIALGGLAARTLLASPEPIARLRGRFHEYQQIKVMPTFHPAYLLRHPEHKRAVWEDVQQVMRLLGLKAGK